jgi:hypothetical protein
MNHLGGMVAGGGVEWLPRATYLASMWWFSPGGAFVDGHPGIKILPCLPCLVYFQCSFMTLWALS